MSFTFAELWTILQKILPDNMKTSVNWKEKSSRQKVPFALLSALSLDIEGKNESGFQGNSVIDGFMNLQWLLPS